jgi:hypothetical protein
MTTTIIVVIIVVSVILTLAVCFLVYSRHERSRKRWYKTTIPYFYNGECDLEWNAVTSLNYLSLYQFQEEQIATAIFLDLKRNDKLTLMSKYAIGLNVSLEELSPQGKLSRVASVEKILESYLVRELKLNSQYSGEGGFELYCKEEEEINDHSNEPSEEENMISYKLSKKFRNLFRDFFC